MLSFLIQHSAPPLPATMTGGVTLTPPQVSAAMELNLITPPREGKKLLVLDIDYTIFDTKVAVP